MGPITSMQIHVGAALLSIPFAVWHVTGRRVRPRRTDLSRRNFLRAATLLGGAGIAYAAVQGIVRLAGLRGADRRVTGSYETGKDDPGRHAGDAVAQRRGADRRSRHVATEDHGRRPSTRAELRGAAAFDDRLRATIDCTGGWFARQDWEGVSLARLVGDPGEARIVFVRSLTGYARRFPVGGVPHLLVATRAGGDALSPGHGFPARLVAPGRRGFWWVNWIETMPTPWWWQSPFPLS